MLEDTAMIYYALKEKSMHKSFLGSLSKVFIQENREYNSKKIYNEIEELEKVPELYLKKLTNANNIWEIRIQYASNIFRVLGFFDSNNF